MVDEQTIRTSWSLRGFSYRAETCEPNDRWEDAGHRVREIILIASGCVEIEIAGQHRLLAPGVEIIVPAGQPHAIRNPGDEPARVLFGYELTPEEGAP